MSGGESARPALPILDRPGGLAFQVKVLPRSARNMTAGLQGEVLRLKLTAPPVEGAANRMCIEYLAERLGTSKSALEIVSGQSARLKLVFVRCAPDAKPEIKRRIMGLAGA
jgi:hypothetical protein